MSTIGERIKKLRKELHITQVELGSVIGITGSAVSQIEANASNPTEAAIRLICSTYHVSYLWLTEGGDNNMFIEDSIGIDAEIERLMAGEPQLAISIMKGFARLPDEEWIKLKNIIDKVKNGSFME